MTAFLPQAPFWVELLRSSSGGPEACSAEEEHP